MNPSKATHIARKLAMALMALAAVTLSSCDSLIYDYEGDCDPHYKVRFRFDWNLHFADAFPHEVNAVTLYIVDPESGNIVWQKSESGADLKEEGYLMDVDDLAPGTYNLLAWCGEGVGPHFDVPEATHHTGLTCTMQRNHETGHDGGTVRTDIKRLYHGRLDAQVFTEDEGTHIYTVPLIKNTNEVNVVLQHLSGEPVDKDDYTFTITAANGSMDWDNHLLDDETITYYAHTTAGGTAGVIWPQGPDDPSVETMGSRAPLTQMSACVASHTINRLTTGQRKDVLVTVYNKKGEKILSIPLIDYALLVKGSYAAMDDQEYLDRQDKYDLVFFLDQGDRWMNAYIYINSWKLVLQDTDL